MLDRGEGVYIWVEAEGNCHWEHHQVCHTNPDGHVVCHDESEWTCDRDTAFYALPETVTADEEAKRYNDTPEDGAPMAVGKIKQFLWNKWISLFEGARLDVTHETAALVLVLVMDPAELGESLREKQFRQLHAD